MQDVAFEQVRDSGESDMRMRPHVYALARRELRRPHMVEKYERPHHFVGKAGQQPPDFKVAEVLGVGFQYCGNACGHRCVLYHMWSMCR